jgi:hypothetical protein
MASELKINKVQNFIGDSHVLKFKDKLYLTKQGTILTKAFHFRGGQIAKIQDGGKLSDWFIALMVSSGILHHNLQPWNSEFNLPKHSLEMAAAGLSVEAPHVCISLGCIDIREHMKLANNSEHGWLPEVLNVYISTYQRVIKMLRSIVGTNLSVYLLDPPTANDLLFSEINGFNISALNRGAAYEYFNSHMRDFCKSFEIKFVHNNFAVDYTSLCAKKEFEFDGGHLHPQHAPRILEALL